MRILIADDSDAVRRGVIGLLSAEPAWEICGEARDGMEALEKAGELHPDLIILDISMPVIGGLETATSLRREWPRAIILVISAHDPARLLPRVIEAGANACLDKSRLASDLLGTIRSLATASSNER
jgi:DNA-binding NarL/FixJ family response regulator